MIVVLLIAILAVCVVILLRSVSIARRVRVEMIRTGQILAKVTEIYDIISAGQSNAAKEQNEVTQKEKKYESYVAEEDK